MTEISGGLRVLANTFEEGATATFLRRAADELDALRELVALIPGDQLCTCVGTVPGNIRAHFDNCLSVLVPMVLNSPSVAAAAQEVRPE